MKSVLRDWVMELPLRHQGVLIAAIRGCDGVPKENSAKPIIRALRYVVLNPADEREVGVPSAFMIPGFSDDELRGFLKDWDHYPVHFVQHLMHACEVVGYCFHGERFLIAYFRMVDKLHLNPETFDDMNDRLTEDRIAKYGNATGEQTFEPTLRANTFDPDAPVEIIITILTNGQVDWETGPSYLGSRVAHGHFATVSEAVDDAVDRFHPAPVSPILRKEEAK
jgi:hypothetical protein